MLGCKRIWWNSTNGALGPDLVVVLAPDGDDFTGLGLRLELVLGEAIIPERAVEAFG